MTPRRCTIPPTGDAARYAASMQALVPVLETDRLILRAPRVEDMALWTDLMAAPPFEEGPEDAWYGFVGYAAGWMLYGHGLWSIERRDDRALVGFVLLGLEWEDEETEIGWSLAPSARGCGYATEAARAVLSHADTLLGTGQTVSYVDAANPASAAVAQRLGARRDLLEEARIAEIEGSSPQVWRHGSVA